MKENQLYLNNINENKKEVSTGEFSPLRTIVYNHIRDLIISGKLKPGERLMENKLSIEIGVSRTPIREALRKLELEGFVQVLPRRGAMVSVITEKDIRDVLEIRTTLEVLAIKNATENINRKVINRLKIINNTFLEAVLSGDIKTMADSDTLFHQVIYETAKNDRLIQIMSNLGEQFQRYRLTYLKSEAHGKDIFDEHNNIIFNLGKKNIPESVEATTIHIEKQINYMILSLKEDIAT